MLVLLSQWSVGFSLFALLLLWAVYWWWYEALAQTPLSRSACTLMLASVGLLQAWHGVALLRGASLAAQPLYLALLYSSAPTFLLFCRTLIAPHARIDWRWLLLALPPLIAPWLPFAVAVPLAFALGGLVAGWLAYRLRSLQTQRKHFALEWCGLVAIAVVAGAIFFAGLLAPWLGERSYMIVYTNLTAAVLFGIVLLLIRFPRLLQTAIEAATASYAVSTLKGADVDALVKRLETLMAREQLFRDQQLSLSRLADAMALSIHQTSELLNTRFKVGFARLLRQYRVDAARVALVQEPSASVLAIGLDAGFSSQSTFYSAFREVTGETPGQYRKRLGIAGPAA